jgi:putative spermidine/putrescine transport system substrate-binding protein
MNRKSRIVIGLLATAVTVMTFATKSAHAEDATAFDAPAFKGLEGELYYYDTSGGPTAAARAETIFKNFKDVTGVEIKADFNSNSTKLFAALEAGGQVPWSLIQFGTLSEFKRAAAQGQLEKLDTSIVPVEKMGEGTVDEYGIHAERFAANLVWNTEKWPATGEQPSSWADLYDTAKFPGKRCLLNYPQYGATFESALLADGVAPEKLYPLDVERALKKLDTIKSDIVWWSNGAQPVQFLSTGECDIGIAWQSRVAGAVNEDKAPIGISWNQAIYSTSAWGIPKGAPNVKAAQAAIAFWILDKKGQVDYITRLPLPTDIKDLKLSDYPESVQPFLPAGDNVASTIPEDVDYYEKNLPQVLESFNAWMQK